jgi:multicomponent K+:H+ antiporter subunit F
MSSLVLTVSVGIAQVMLVVAMGCATYRTGSSVYFEAALIIALLGFVGTVALAKFLMRGEVIE